jgi:hypothetical protein
MTLAVLVVATAVLIVNVASIIHTEQQIRKYQ